MMKNKIIKFKIIGVMAYFIIMLSANPQNLVLEGADEKVHEDSIRNLAESGEKVNLLKLKVGQLESEISNIKSENKKNLESLQDEIKKINDDILKQGEDNKEWKRKFVERLNGIDGKLEKNVESLRDIQKLLNDHSNNIHKIWPKVSDIESKLGDIETRLKDIEELYKKVNERLPEISKLPEEDRENKPVTSQIKEEDRGEKGLSFIASHLIPIIFIIIVILAIVFVFLWFEGVQESVFSLFKKDPEGKGSGAGEDSERRERERERERKRKFDDSVSDPGPPSVKVLKESRAGGEDAAQTVARQRRISAAEGGANKSEVETDSHKKLSVGAKRGTEELCEEGKIQEEEVIKPPLTKSFKEDLLVAWWNREENGYKNGTKNLKECEDSLKKEFGKNIVINVITGNPSDTDDWYIIGIESPESKLSYVIPRRFGFSKEMEKWFSAEKGIDDLKKMVSDLMSPAERDMGGNRNMPTKRGKVRLM